MAVQDRPDTGKNREIRVFVSSTFKDMQVEREELVKKIFPRLRKICEQRGVNWGEVDLRWGITDEEKAEGKVLPICLAEIEHCRPYFIGLLGERYGWINDQIPYQVLEQYNWLKECKGKSVTELEIINGVLKDKDMSGHAYFYFRDPAYLDTLGEMERIDYVDAPSEKEEKKGKLEALKSSIRESGFPLRENYATPKALGDLVLADFTSLIDRLYPEGEKLDPLDRARFDHGVFAESRFNTYIPRSEYYDRLNTHVNGDSSPLVVVGKSGSGKSALLVNWAKRFGGSLVSGPFLIIHYVGATPDSADWASMLRRIMGELKRRFNIQENVPDKPDALKAVFANWLHMASAKGKIVLVIDALNQLEDRDGALELFWLPEHIPANVRLIVSSLPGKPLDELTKRGWPTLEVKPLLIEERKKLIKDYLAQYKKKLPDDTIELISSHGQADNPLFLRALLEEIRLHGDHYTLNPRINHYLLATTIEDLFAKILERYEQDYNDREGLVRDAFSCLSVARKGLSHAELLDLLGSKGQPLPGALWSPIYLATEKSLVSRGGIINFSHDHIRGAVLKRYLPDEDKENRYHLILADYFEKRELNNRKVEELPWQLSQAKSWDRLSNLLVDRQFFVTSLNTNEFDVKGYWARIENNSQLRMTQVYRQMIDTPSEYESTFILLLSTLLRDTGHWSETLSLLIYLSDYFRKNNDQQLLGACLGHQATILYDRGDLDGAVKLLKEQERICREMNDPLEGCLGNQAAILYARGDLDGSLKLLKEMERICRELNNPHVLQACLGNQGAILKVRGDLDGSIILLKEQERICRELNNPDSLQACLGNQAMILETRGDLSSAMKLHKEQERICRELNNPYGLQVSLGSQAMILKARGDLDGAMKLHKEQERICRELNNSDGLQRCLGSQAMILNVRGNLDGAMKLHKEQERICRELNNPHGLQVSLGSQAMILKTRGDLDGAMKLHKEEERICRVLNNPDSLQACLGNQAMILKVRGDLSSAMKLHNEQERICRELNNPDGLQACLGNQATILYARGDLDGAMKLHNEEERICRVLNNPDSLQACLGNQALILKARGDLDGAMKLLKEQERICRVLNNPDSLQACLGNQATILYARGDSDGSIILFKEQERICRVLNNPDGLSVSLGNQAMILKDMGDLDGAMKLLKEQERISRELNNPDGLQTCLGSQAMILYARGDSDGSIILFKEQERICRELNDFRGIEVSLGNQAKILQVRGDLDGAMKLFSVLEGICRELYNQDSLQACLGSQAMILHARGDLDGAMKHLKEMEGICRELNNRDGLQTSLGNQATILYAKGDLDGAMKLHKEEEGICRELNNQDGLQTSLDNQAMILEARGDLEGAMKLLKEQERICRELNNLDRLQTCLDSQANILEKKGDLDGAMKLHKEEQKIWLEQNDPDSLWMSLAYQAKILQAKGDLDGAMKLLKEQERICSELDNKEGLSISLINQAGILINLNCLQDALPVAEAALKIANDYGYTALATKIRPIVDLIRSKYSSAN